MAASAVLYTVQQRIMEPHKLGRNLEGMVGPPKSSHGLCSHVHVRGRAGAAAGDHCTAAGKRLLKKIGVRLSTTAESTR